jgi:hypothetical protein
MRFKMDEAIEVLSATPSVLRGLLGRVSEPWIRNNYGDKTFSPFDVVGHLIHGERTDWIPRGRIILEHGEAKAFDPFDRYAMYEESKGKSISELLDTFERLREANIEALRGMKLSDARLDGTGTHPRLGRVTMRELLAMWVVHDLSHVHQIAKSMAHQYADQIGPWRPWVTFLPSE